MENFAVQVFADSQDELERFVCLDAADNTRERADGATFGTRGDEPCRGWRRVLATVARTAIQIEYADLAFELVNRAEYNRNAMQCASVVDQVTGLIIVRAIDNQIVTFDLFPNVRSLEFFFFGDKVDVPVDVLDFVPSRCDFGALEVACAVNNLALQVFQRDFIKIDDLDGSNACSCEVFAALMRFCPLTPISRSIKCLPKRSISESSNETALRLSSEIKLSTGASVGAPPAIAGKSKISVSSGRAVSQMVSTVNFLLLT